MANVKNNASAQETRRRLIEAAGRVFADRGVHGATIKEITKKAGVNMAAINYHFTDKFELYTAVIHYSVNLLTRFVAAPEISARSPEQRLHAYIAGVFEHIYDPSRPSWQPALLANEFAQPTAALTTVLEELLRPRAVTLTGIVREILGPGASEDQVVWAAISVWAPTFVYMYSGQSLQRLFPGLLRKDQKQELVSHICAFSLAGLRGLRRQLKPRP